MKRIRIVSDGTVAGSNAYDDETGERIENVMRIEVLIDPQANECVAVLQLYQPIVEATMPTDMRLVAGANPGHWKTGGVDPATNAGDIVYADLSRSIPCRATSLGLDRSGTVHIK